MLFTRIGKREARARYDRGEVIAMASESWWFDSDRECSGFDRASMGGCTFDELHPHRPGSGWSYAKPVPVVEGWEGTYPARPEWWDDETEPRCDDCGIHMEEAARWCGECGCCREHCQGYAGCERTCRGCDKPCGTDYCDTCTHAGLDDWYEWDRRRRGIQPSGPYVYSVEI